MDDRRINHALRVLSKNLLLGARHRKKNVDPRLCFVGEEVTTKPASTSSCAGGPQLSYNWAHVAIEKRMLRRQNGSVKTLLAISNSSLINFRIPLDLGQINYRLYLA